MRVTDKNRMTPEAAVTPVEVEVEVEPDAEARAWRDKKIRRGIQAADEGRFATPERLRRVIRKYVPHG